jgi:hypothetical protein
MLIQRIFMNVPSFLKLNKGSHDPLSPPKQIPILMSRELWEFEIFLDFGSKRA